jgi:hypothetical protein
VPEPDPIFAQPPAEIDFLISIKGREVQEPDIEIFDEAARFLYLLADFLEL